MIDSRAYSKKREGRLLSVKPYKHQVSLMALMPSWRVGTMRRWIDSPATASSSWNRT